MVLLMVLLRVECTLYSEDVHLATLCSCGTNVTGP
jgi:hypothetical protein